MRQCSAYKCESCFIYRYRLLRGSDTDSEDVFFSRHFKPSCFRCLDFKRCNGVVVHFTEGIPCIEILIYCILDQINKRWKICGGWIEIVEFKIYVLLSSCYNWTLIKMLENGFSFVDYLLKPTRVMISNILSFLVNKNRVPL